MTFVKVQVYYMTKETWYESVREDPSQANVTERLLKEGQTSKFFKVDERTILSTGDIFEDAEKMFALYNLDFNPLATSEKQSMIKINEVSHTSMSIGDFIVINDETLIVDDCGFRKVEVVVA